MMLWFATAWALDPWPAVESARVTSEEALVSPTETQRAELAAVVSALVKEAPTGTVSEALKARASALGAGLDLDGNTARVTHPGGWGLAIVRLGPAEPLVLQAPHPWFDLGTGALVGQLFDSQPIRAAVFSTVHRKLGPHTDAAHAPAGGFQALTLGLAQGIEAPVFVQIHGFGDGRTAADLVVGGWGADPLAASFQPLGWIATDGTAVPQLAGRKNAQVQSLAGQVPVAHLELSKAVRTALAKDPDLRARFAQILREWAR